MADDVKPPWDVYLNEDPWWGGWRQGTSEVWLHNTWLPFWRGLTAGERQTYLERWPPPHDEWREYLLIHWIK